MRALGVDLGTRRVGIAISDAGATVATPHSVIHRSGDRGRDHRAIAELVAELEVEQVVVGLPLSLDGTMGPAARAMAAEAEELGDVLNVPVETWDERLTTVTAERSLREMGVKGTKRRKVVDQLAATVMLQSWLDRHRMAAP